MCKGLSSLSCVPELADISLAEERHTAKPRASVGGDVTRARIPGGWFIVATTSLSLYFISSKTRVKITALFSPRIL